ncbi:MAG: hypothetical protein CVU52_03750 [Deltaproteobacteria bacterium HGW-Deltaproteobacteria-10]|nr:MAG: hypothetical protein CVU52_03750 [Deltaproteobacteria bacterium HGW-Deltaproteobacteria-10]
MKGIRLLIFSTLLLASCQTLPAINSVLPQARLKSALCPSPFLKEPYRLVHAIEARSGGEIQGAIIGVTLVDPSTRFVSCAIMTAEGMVLFEAEAKPALKVIRALPPFDSGHFAKNMIEDIKLIFLAPEGVIQTKGILADGTGICRWQEKSGAWIDLIAGLPDGIEINKYSSSGNWQRRIKLNPTAENVYSRIELKAREAVNYSLTMTLIEAEPQEGELKTEKNKGSEE